MNAKALAAITIALGAPTAIVACILADPPPIVTPPPTEPPHIIRESVTPPPGQLLTMAPPCTNVSDCFVVPVTVDLNASITFKVFIDLDPQGSGTQAPINQQTDDGGVLAVGPDASPGVRLLTFNVNQGLLPFDATQCHVITFIVAYGFFANDFAQALPPGGDRVDWFYQPKSDCTFYDAGALPEGGD